jgi:hypothetical protein
MSVTASWNGAHWWAYSKTDNWVCMMILVLNNSIKMNYLLHVKQKCLFIIGQISKWIIQLL